MMNKPFKYLFCAALLLLAFLACTMVRDIAETSTPAAEQTASPTNTDGAAVVWIPGGAFWMGSEATDAAAAEDEMPRHQVTLDGFFIYTHEVTNEMYAECVAAGGCLPVNVMDSGPTTHSGDPAYTEHPVVGVDWNMANDYCAWAGGRLPTEAEWELAARGTDSLRYPWGAEDPTCDRVNMFGCNAPPDTLAIGSLANGNSPYAVWDMAGNVWEWVNDWYAEHYYTFSPPANPFGPPVNQDPNHPRKVVRGGGLYSEPDKLRGAERAGANPYRTFDDVGFRCVPMGELALPEGYEPALDRREMVPPDPLDGGGEHAEDPEEEAHYRLGFADVSCPTSDGRVFLVIEADSSEDVEYEVTVDGIPFDCLYDEMLRVLHCEGPVPETTEFPDMYHGQVQFIPHGGIGHFYLEKPTDCGALPPDRFSMDLACPVDGLFTISFFYEPPITWDTVQISGEDIPCVAVSETETRCTAPDLRTGDHYEFYLHGIGADGTEYEWTPWAPVLEDCPGLARFLDVSPFCFEGHPTIQVMYGEDWPPLISVVETLATGGFPNALDCIGVAPGVHVCGDLMNVVGVSAYVQIWFGGGDLHDFHVIVPACPGTETEIGYSIGLSCWPPEAEAAAASIHYWPFDEALVAANANGFDLTCIYTGVQWYMCTGVPGAAGSATTITFCLADGRCFSDTGIIPACGEPPVGIWLLSEVGCHSETALYVIIDTGLDWLVPGAAFDYNVAGGGVIFGCEPMPGSPGRLYCSGDTMPSFAGGLQVCIRRDGEAEPTCRTFDDFTARAPATCVEEPPPPEPPAPSCSDYTTQASCLANGCKWTKGPPDGLEHCYPP
jgi:formylglycine-generating enzyme required for sulfatase activity